MPDYRFDLHDGPDHPPIAETVSAADPAEALELAEVRLLLTPDYTDIAVSLNGVEVGRLTRDSVVWGRGVPMHADN